jgi:hypothetical protein
MNCYRNGLVLLSIAMAYRRVGEFPSLAGYFRGHHDDSVPGAVKYRNTSRDSMFDPFMFPVVWLLAASLTVITRSCEDYTKKNSMSPAVFGLDSFRRLILLNAPYLLAYDWCTYRSQLCMGCCRTRIRSFQAGAISMQ